MHKKFDSTAIEKKWQQQWEKDGLYNVGKRDESKEKEYVLVEWPYPSGNLHIGHWYAFAVPDIYVRYRRMNGKQVIYPMGFDAFGLPAENAAIKRNINPKNWTNENIAFMKGQLASMGNAFSWDKTTNSTDPEYYKWTQRMFTKFFENDIAYRGKGIVNWCPGCNTVIANEQVLADGTCERSGDIIEKKEMPQWMLRITKYADRLIDDLDALDWPEHIKEAQRQWIGRSRGAEIDFTLNLGDASSTVNRTITVFTTRPETLYGATYLVLAPEHTLVTENKGVIKNWSEVEEYINVSKKKDEQDRLDATKEKTGVKLEGITAINPANNEEIPVYIADYVLAGYGTGAIMAVPAHDERDYEFAKKFNLPIKQVVAKHYEFETKPGVETIDRGEAVDLIIEHPTDGTFLIQREKSEQGDQVHLVGGGTDGDGHHIAIKRELLEETGFSNYKIISGPHFVSTVIGYRHTRDKNQKTKASYYHIKLNDLKQVSSEIEEGKHTIEWVQESDVTKLINWRAHAEAWEHIRTEKQYTGTGKLIYSGEFDGMDSEEAKEAIVKKVGGRMTSTYRLRDWSIGRQRYWGVPIPIVYDPEGKAHPVPEKHLPWTLPEDVDFKPTGEAPLAKSKVLLERTEEIFGKGWTPEVETMDTFVDSSWYFLRYVDNKNPNSLSSLEEQKKWMPIDIYFGGAEHTTMHLLYSRFWQKALLDLGLVTESEPYKRRINRGLILGPDGNKMSKSKGNVIDPDAQVKLVGSDTVKIYLAFMGPYEGANYPFDLGGIAGVRRFLERVYGLSDHLAPNEPKEVTVQLHKTIAKVREDIEAFKFNTAISAMMIYVNMAEKTGLTKSSYQTFIKLLAPFAPHLTEEVWSLDAKDSIHESTYPVAEAELLVADTVTLGIQVNGKLRGDITIKPTATEEEALAQAFAEENIIKYASKDSLIKVIYVPGRILNLVVKSE
ncbi:MAG: class I tRNA ligase family protein [Candidatus Paceibacterota bacterium]